MAAALHGRKKALLNLADFWQISGRFPLTQVIQHAPPEIPDNPRSNAQVGQKILLNQELDRSGWIHLGIPEITKRDGESSSNSRNRF
jgi:hypothetical protein